MSGQILNPSHFADAVESPMNMQVVRLAHALTEIQDRICQLRERLDPVLTPMVGTDVIRDFVADHGRRKHVDAERASTPIASKLVATMNERANLAESLSYELRDLMTRIEL